MSDVNLPPIDAEDDPNKGIQIDANGDPVRQGSLMNELQSYERVIEGLKMASDAAMHLAKHEGSETFQKIANNLDQARRICVQYAGLGLAMKHNETGTVRGDPMGFRDARGRFREGLIQAAGGLRQLATCHRGDLWWSTMATQLEQMQQKLDNIRKAATRRAVSSLILPPGYLQ